MEQAAQGELVNPEDAKLVTLSRGSRARIGARAGAAVRDDIGRSYSAADVALPSLAISALQLSVAQAVSAGAAGLEAAVVVSRGGEVAAADLQVVRDLGGVGVPVFGCGSDGHVISRVTT